MKKSLAHLPKHKREELRLITKTILKAAPITQMVILFGSHARGDWIEDVTIEANATYEYRSDYDILIVVPSQNITYQGSTWHNVKRKIRELQLKTWTTIIVHGIKQINKHLRFRQYFFTDIKKDGIMLYNSGRFKLKRRRKLNLERRGKIAKIDFDQWFKTAKEFYYGYECHIAKRHFKLAAFNLHQTTECFYGTIILVFTNYKPKTHDLETLLHLACSQNAEFLTIFPRATKAENECFDLLNDAYVKARFERNYKITKKQLEYLAQRVRKLKRLTNKICKEKIESFT